VPIDLIIPSSFTSNLPSLMQRSMAAAAIARAAAIFKVDTIYIYPDPLERASEARRQVAKILKYMNVAPYLRKHLFGIDRDLEYVGLLPPLRTPLHKEKVPLRELVLPDYREGVVVKSSSDYSVVDVGLDKPAVVEGKLHRGKHVIVRINKVSSTYLRAELVDREDIPVYPGYRVVNVKTKVVDFLKQYDGKLIFTSRRGVGIWEVKDKIASLLDGRIGLVFGGPNYGVFEILEHYGVSPYDFSDLVVNVVPDQGVATIRVEEAVIITLAILAMINAMRGGADRWRGAVAAEEEEGREEAEG